MRNENVLIVGCGYLGMRAAGEWLREGCHVTALTRSPQRAEEWGSLGINPVIGNVLDVDSLSSLPNADVCLYAVGYDRAAEASKRAVYVDGLRNVLQTLSGRVERFIYISSSSVYGQDAGEWVNEDSLCEPISEGGRICRDAENVVREFYPASDESRSGVILRLTGIYGPGRLIARRQQLLQGTPLTGLPDAWLNLIHVDDAVQVVRKLAVFPSPPLLSLLSDAQPLRRREFYGAMTRCLGAPEPVFDPQGSSSLGKRCDSRRIRESLGIELTYPCAIDALEGLLRDSSN